MRFVEAKKPKRGRPPQPDGSEEEALSLAVDEDPPTCR